MAAVEEKGKLWDLAVSCRCPISDEILAWHDGVDKKRKKTLNKQLNRLKARLLLGHSSSNMKKLQGLGDDIYSAHVTGNICVVFYLKLQRSGESYIQEKICRHLVFFGYVTDDNQNGCTQPHFTRSKIKPE